MMTTRSRMRTQAMLGGLAVAAGGTLIAVGTPAPVLAAEPSCTLSPYHEVEAKGANVDRGMEAGTAYTGNGFFDNNDWWWVGAQKTWKNTTAHTMYNTREVIVVVALYPKAEYPEGYAGGIYFESNGEGRWSVPEGTLEQWQTGATQSADPDTEGFEVYFSGDVAYASASDLGVTLTQQQYSGGTTTVPADGPLPYYVLSADTLAPGVSGTTQGRVNVENFANKSGWSPSTVYHSSLVTQTCLPETTIEAWPEDNENPLAPISGTGTTAGDTVEVTNDSGDVIGTATVGDDLTWSIIPSQPVGQTRTRLTVTATDEFGFTATASGDYLVAGEDPDPDPTVSPEPSASATPDPSASATPEPSGSATPPTPPGSTPSVDAGGSTPESLAATGAQNRTGLLVVGGLFAAAGMGILARLQTRR